MANYVVYTSGGEILRSGSAPTAAKQARRDGEFAIEVDSLPRDIDNYIVQGGELVEKTTLSPTIDKTTVTANERDFITISNLPNPCRIRIENKKYRVTDGIAEITFNLPGEFKVIVEAQGNKPWEVMINANQS